MEQWPRGPCAFWWSYPESQLGLARCGEGWRQRAKWKGAAPAPEHSSTATPAPHTKHKTKITQTSTNTRWQPIQQQQPRSLCPRNTTGQCGSRGSTTSGAAHAVCSGRRQSALAHTTTARWRSSRVSLRRRRTACSTCSATWRSRHPRPPR